MKKTMIRFLANFNATDSSGNSSTRFHAGRDYDPATDHDGEMKRGIARGIATEVEIEVPDEPEAGAEPTTDAARGSEAVAVTAEAAGAEAKPAKAKK